jgi:hypothetical protein
LLPSDSRSVHQPRATGEQQAGWNQQRDGARNIISVRPDLMLRAALHVDD